jgi:hypothetical protein
MIPATRMAAPMMASGAASAGPVTGRALLEVVGGEVFVDVATSGTVVGEGATVVAAAVVVADPGVVGDGVVVGVDGTPPEGQPSTGESEGEGQDGGGVAVVGGVVGVHPAPRVNVCVRSPWRWAFTDDTCTVNGFGRIGNGCVDAVSWGPTSKVISGTGPVTWMRDTPSQCDTTVTVAVLQVCE